MADNAVYDSQMAPTADTAAITPNGANISMAPTPLPLSPEEQIISMQKQNGIGTGPMNYNPGGSEDLAAMQSGAKQSAKAYQDEEQQQLAMQNQAANALNPDLDFLDNGVQNQQRKIEQKKLDMAAPLYSKMKAQDDLYNASHVLEQSKQEILGQKQSLEEEQVQKFQNFKKTYDDNVKIKMLSLDNELKQVDEDARLARQSTSDLFASKSTGQKIAAGIAVLLGAAGGVMKGDGRNLGLETINNALENDRKQLLNNFAQSKEMLALKQRNLDEYNNAMIKQMEMADRQKMLQMQVVASKLGVAESRYKDSAAGATAKDAKAGIEMMINQMKGQQASNDALNNMLKGATGGGDLPNQLQTLGLPKEARDAIEETRALTVQGYHGVARSKEDRDQFQKIRQSQEPAISGLQRILELQKQGKRWNLEQRAKIASETNAVIGNLREAIVGPGAMTESEFERIKDTVGDQNKLFTLPTLQKAKLTTAINKLKSDLSSIAKMRGFTPPQEFQANFNPSNAQTVEAKYKKFLK